MWGYSRSCTRIVLVLQILTINVKHALNLVFLSNVSETKTAGASSFWYLAASMCKFASFRLKQAPFTSPQNYNLSSPPQFLCSVFYSSSLSFRASLLWSAVSEPTDSSSMSSMTSSSSSVSLVTYEPFCRDKHHSSTVITQISSSSTPPTIPTEETGETL